MAGWLLAAAGDHRCSRPASAAVTNSDQSAFLPDTAESAQAADLAKAAFPDGQGASAVIVVDGSTAPRSTRPTRAVGR